MAKRAGRDGRSRGEMMRRRARAQFVGRREQLSLFADNLARDPDAEEHPAEFLFHVRGVGGVGKSTLLRQWRESARRAGALTAVVDESDAHGVLPAMAELIRQLAAHAGPLKEFDRAAEQYQRDLEAATEPLPGDVPQDMAPSMSSRVVAQAALGAASLIPAVGVATAMASPDAAAQGLDRLRSGARTRRGRGADTGGVSRAFVAELARLGERHPWVVLFFDTWEQTSRSLDAWLRTLLQDGFGPFPTNVIVVLAGRDALDERAWAPFQPYVTDVPLEVFTEAETRALLAARGITDPEVTEAVLRLSMGLPLLVALLALAQPGTAVAVGADGDLVDTAVERFVQWITDPVQRATVLACALAPQLNADIFTAAAPPEAGGLWEWLCGQPFVTGHGDFKRYHPVVRASMVRQRRAHSPQGWAAAHLALAEGHAAWRATIAGTLPPRRRWDDARWRRHRADETYHRLCAHPAAELPAALEGAVWAAGQGFAALRQWTDMLDQAARDTADADLQGWADRLRTALSGGDGPVLGALTALLTHGALSPTARARAHAERGWHLYDGEDDEEALAELDRAVALDPDNADARTYRGEVHRWLGHLDEAITDFTTALGIDPDQANALAARGEAHRRADRYDEAITDLTAALELRPDDAWALASRGQAHRQNGDYDQAIADLTAAVDLNPGYAWAVAGRGETHRLAGRYDQAITDFTTAIGLKPEYAWALASRGQAHRQNGDYDQAIADLTAAVDISPGFTWALAERGEAHRLAGRYDQAITDFTTAIGRPVENVWALGSRGQALAQMGRYDEAVADLTACLELRPDYGWALFSRGEAHRLAGRPDDAITDFTAALALDPHEVMARYYRGVAHRQTRRFGLAREDFERVGAAEGDTSGLLLDLLLLDTVESGFDACAARWTEFLTGTVSTPADVNAPLAALLRVLLLEPEGLPLEEAVDRFYAGEPDEDVVWETPAVLAELAALDNSPLARRALRCHRLVTGHPAHPRPV
ncbi:tetratricopeptide repeat protein [Streptomyces sp. NPDC057638]|uniref:tetratricopeptide repeat protein n=1 Tax=Streptomyces sp. NPDC057638 TaxID=3346190 RepID=UPI0036740296